MPLSKSGQSLKESRQDSKNKSKYNFPPAFTSLDVMNSPKKLTTGGNARISTKHLASYASRMPSQKPPGTGNYTKSTILYCTRTLLGMQWKTSG